MFWDWLIFLRAKTYLGSTSGGRDTSGQECQKRAASPPRSSIEDDHLYGISLLLHCNPSLPIDIDGFTLNFLDIDVLLQMWCSHNSYAEASFEERDIGNDRLRGMMRLLHRRVAYMFPYSLSTLFIFCDS
jgi:hypothetical protein